MKGAEKTTKAEIRSKARIRCEFVGDSSVVEGKLIPCQEPPVWVLRLQGIEAIQMGKRAVCEIHKDSLLSPTVVARGRVWQIDPQTIEGHFRVRRKSGRR